MKNNRHGQAGIVTDEQLTELLNEMEPRHKLLFAIAYYTSARISEVLKLERSDIRGGFITFKKANTKTQTTRQVRVHPTLQTIIDEVGLPASGWVFSGKRGDKHLTRQAADAALRKACDFIGIEGVSTHSFRRTGITKLYRNGVSLKSIQKHTGHRDLDNLVLYIELDQSELDAVVGML